MMKIDKALISHLENLARLELSDSEKEHLVVDLKHILDMVETMQGLNTDNVEPLVYINESENVLREDKVQNQIPRAKALDNAPDSNEQYFKVPKVIDI